MFSRRDQTLKPRNPAAPHSLEQLKYLYQVLQKHKTITKDNQLILVESLRSIAEILVWGDQNDPTVMDFFLEKNVIGYFLVYMKQNSNGLVSNQLLQSINIVFDNIRNKSALYYFLSNNMTDIIITHKFNFNDDEIMGYYISFLKTLAARLDSDTIAFFYNQNNRDFPLYIEALKYFNHSESMVRAAVRTIILQIYKIKYEPVIRFAYSRTAVPYFSHLVYYVGSNDLKLSNTIHNERSDLSKYRDRLEDMVVDTIDSLHYIADILQQGLLDLNDVLVDQMLRHLYIPLHIYSLNKRNQFNSHTRLRTETLRRPSLLPAVAMFLLAEFFSIVTYPDLVRVVAECLMLGDLNLTLNFETVASSAEIPKTTPAPRGEMDTNEFEEDLLCSAQAMQSVRSASPGSKLGVYSYQALCLSPPASPVKGTEVRRAPRLPVFKPPKDSLSEMLRRNTRCKEMQLPTVLRNSDKTHSEDSEELLALAEQVTGINSAPEEVAVAQIASSGNCTPDEVNNTVNDTDSICSRDSQSSSSVAEAQTTNNTLANRPYWRAIMRCLEINTTSDYDTFFALCLLHKIKDNPGLDRDTLALGNLHELSQDNNLVHALIEIICDASKQESRMRTITLYLAMHLLASLNSSRAAKDTPLDDAVVAKLTDALEQSTMAARSYHQHEIFLEMFEDEIRLIQHREISVDRLLRSSRFLVPDLHFTTGNIGTLGELKKYNDEHIFRVPRNEPEFARRAIAVFLAIHAFNESRFQPFLETKGANNTSAFKFNITRLKALQGLCDFHEPNSPAPWKIGDKLDLKNRDLNCCNVTYAKGLVEKRYLVIESSQLLLVEPDAKKIGWAVIRFVGNLQECVVEWDNADSRVLRVSVHHPGQLLLKHLLKEIRTSGVPAVNTKRLSHQPMNHPNTNLNLASVVPLLEAKFCFDDYIRCMSAQTLLTRERARVRNKKLNLIAPILDIREEILRDTMPHQPQSAPIASSVLHQPLSCSPASKPVSGSVVSSHNTQMVTDRKVSTQEAGMSMLSSELVRNSAALYAALSTSVDVGSSEFLLESARSQQEDPLAHAVEEALWQPSRSRAFSSSSNGSNSIGNFGSMRTAQLLADEDVDSQMVAVDLTMPHLHEDEDKSTGSKPIQIRTNGVAQDTKSSSPLARISNIFSSSSAASLIGQLSTSPNSKRVMTPPLSATEMTTFGSSSSPVHLNKAKVEFE